MLDGEKNEVLKEEELSVCYTLNMGVLTGYIKNINIKLLRHFDGDWNKNIETRDRNLKPRI